MEVVTHFLRRSHCGTWPKVNSIGEVAKLDDKFNNIVEYHKLLAKHELILIRHLLKHPVITSFLWYKWQRIRRYNTFIL